MDRETQYWAVKKRLSDRKWHSCFQLAFTSLRYGARIYELRQKGFKIESREKRNGRQRWVEYRMLP